MSTVVEVGLRIEFADCTDVGMERSENQDSLLQASCPLGELFVVCDGMGGHRGGSLASQLAVKTIGKRFAKASGVEDPRDVLREAIEAANHAVHERSHDTTGEDLEGMGTTCVAMIVQQDGALAHIAHVGDSRIYRLRGEKIEQLTRDHTAVQDMIDRGVITPEQAEGHPSSNVINRSVGVRAEVEVEVREAPLETQDKDLYLLCSDGLSGMMDDEDIYRYLVDLPVSQVAQELVDLSNARGGYDNVTVIVVNVGEARVPEAGPSRSGMARLSDLLSETGRKVESALSGGSSPEAESAAGDASDTGGSRMSFLLIGVALLTVLAIVLALV